MENDSFCFDSDALFMPSLCSLASLFASLLSCLHCLSSSNIITRIWQPVYPFFSTHNPCRYDFWWRSDMIIVSYQLQRRKHLRFWVNSDSYSSEFFLIENLSGILVLYATDKRGGQKSNTKECRCHHFRYRFVSNDLLKKERVLCVAWHLMQQLNGQER